MKSQHDAGPLLDGVTLARMVHQARLADPKLTADQAAAEALEAWRAAHATIAAEERKGTPQDVTATFVASLHFNVPMPKQWPATLKDFYRCVLKARDETACQPRFKRFLLSQINTEQNEFKQRIETLLRFWQSNDNTALGEWLKKLRSQMLDTEEAVQNEVQERFADWKGHTFEERRSPEFSDWEALASAYLEWWKLEKAEAKVRAGRARAAKAHDKRKQLKTPLAASIVQNEGTAQAKKVSRTKKERHRP